MRRLTEQGRILFLRGFRSQDSEKRRRARSEAGSSLVEFAFSATILIGVVFGMMAMCTGLYIYHFISEAAREGTRYAMVRGSSCGTYSGFTSACPATAAQIQTYVQNLDYPGIVPSRMTVSTTWPTTGSACTPTVTPCNNPGNLVRVTVTYSYGLSLPSFSHLLALTFATRTLSLTSTSQMVIAD
jgi:Flp pilus assembly protein TadG